MRQEDWAKQEDVSFLKRFYDGKWEIKTIGGDANKWIVYDTDNVTPIRKLQLFDSLGAPTVSNPFKRIPE